MTDCELLAELRALIGACDASRRVSIDNWTGVENDTEHYLIPRGAWDTLVKLAKKEED